MGKWAAMLVVYNEEEYIEYAISSVIDRMDHVLVLRGLKPWHGSELELDRTSDRVRALDASKVTLVEGVWRSEADQRNQALSLAEELGCEFGLVIDADEVYGPQDLDSMIEVVEANPHVDGWCTSWWTYWKSPLWRIVPPEPFRPIVVLRLDPSIRFDTQRQPTVRVVGDLSSPQPFLHHFSYAKPAHRITDKIRTFEHADEILEGWWEDKWLAWDTDHALVNLHPTVPQCYRRAQYFGPDGLPEIMRTHPYVTDGVNGLTVQFVPPKRSD